MLTGRLGHSTTDFRTLSIGSIFTLRYDVVKYGECVKVSRTKAYSRNLDKLVIISPDKEVRK